MTRDLVSQSVDDVKVTIGLTCFNAEDTIARALQSALAQDCLLFEILVVDDCSSDHSWKIILDFAAKYPCVRAVRHDVNQGPAGARNTIMELAEGEVIAFFDDDDQSFPQRVRSQYAVLTAHEPLAGDYPVLCFASGVRRYPNGYEYPMHAIGSQAVVPYGSAVADYLLYNARRPGWFYGAGTPTCALMLRVATLKSLGGFDPALRRVEDVDLAVRVALKGGYFVGCPEKLFIQYATVANDKTAQKNLDAELALLDKHAHYLKSCGSYHYSRRWFYIRYLYFSGQKWRFIVALSAFVARYPVWALQHILRSLPRRWAHEKKINQDPAA